MIEYYALFSPPLPSLSSSALSSCFGDDHHKSAEFWDEELLFKYVNMKKRNGNVRCTTLQGPFVSWCYEWKWQSKFKFIITFKQAVFEENWNYFSKIKTQQDIETRKGGSKQGSQGLFCWREKSSCHWMGLHFCTEKGFPSVYQL